MKSPFIDFSEEEYKKYLELFSYNTELEDGKIIVQSEEGTSITLVKHYSGDVYMEIEEEEGMFLQEGNYIYLTGDRWWSKLNHLDRLVEDMKSGNELDYGEYE